MKYLSLLVAALCCIVCTQAQEPRVVTVSVQVLHRSAATPKSLVFHFTNPFFKTSVAAEPDTTGWCVAKGELVVPQNITVRVANDFINLWMEPGDSVHLVIDAARLAEQEFAWLQISGDHAERSTRLNRAHQYVATLKDPRYDWRQSPADMLAAIHDAHRQKMAAYDAYASDKTPDPVIRAFMERDVLFGISNYVTDYVFDSLPVEERAARIAIFRDPLFGLHDPANFKSMLFAYHLGWYAQWITNLDSTVLQARKAGRYAEAMQAGVAVLQKEPRGLCRDYMLYTFLQGLCLKEPSLWGALPQYDPLFAAAFVPYCLQRSLDKALSTDFPIRQLAGVYHLGANEKEQSLPATDIVALLGQRYAGKVIYVDVYATWCGPCRQELPLIPALQAAYNDRDVVFVNICVQDNLSSWKKLVRDQQWGGAHYWLDADASKLFLGHYRAAGVPVYWLIDRQGKIVSTNAPRPSAGVKLHAQLDRLLEQ